MRYAECHPDRIYHARNMCAPCYSKWLLTDPIRKEKHKKQVRANYEGYRQEMHDALGHACTCCGEAEKVFLTLEHINNDGAEHRRRVGGDQCSTFSALLDARKQGWPKDKFTVLCANCQRGALQPGGCPHKRMN